MKKVMPMGILDELYYGNIDPHTRRVQPDTQLGKTRALLVQNENKMRAMMNEEQRDWFERCKELEGEISELQDREMFANGFCLAVKIMAEVMSTMESPSVDD